jgi:hypothetical protein
MIIGMVNANREATLCLGGIGVQGHPISGRGYRDLVHLANCSPGGTGPYVTSPACSGKDPALRAEARFRARF